MSFLMFVILRRRRRIPIFHGILRCAQNDKEEKNQNDNSKGLGMTKAKISR